MTRPGVKQPPGSESAATIRDRGAVGAVLLTARQAAAQVVAFIGILVLAHLLTPTTLGMLALGTTIVTVGTFFADGGLGAALVRKTEEPTVDELRTLLAMQLGLACAIALGVAAVGSQAGTVGTVTAIMACSLPVLAFRAPHAIVLERALDYQPIAAIEFAESLVFYGWAIATVEVGWGVFGVASAAIVRALTGSVLMSVASPIKLITPRLAPRTLRSMLGFGIGFQAVGLTALARTQGVNLVVVAVGGEQLLGYWSVAYRLMQIPFWVFQALWRVSYPTMARLRAYGEDTRLTVERFARLTALASGAVLAPLAASAHFIVPALFGDRWAPAASPIPWASAGLLVAGPISVAATGYLYSEKDVRTPLLATILGGAVWISLTAVLLRPLGIAAVGLALMVASWTEALLFSRALWRAGIAVSRMIVVPVALAVASALVAQALQEPLASALIPGIITATVALSAYLALSFAFNRSDLLATARRVRSLT
ncbi:MAG: oligosaccharide flippase family protein [Solirubrobacteraceae bacterium]